METGLQHGAAFHRTSEALQQRLLRGLNHHDAGGKPQNADPDQGECRQGILQVMIEPGVADLESELVIERLGGGAEESATLAQQANDAALVQQPDRAALNPGTIDLEDQSDERLQRDERE